MVKTNTEIVTAPTNTNGNEGFAGTGPTQPQRNNYQQRAARPAMMGNGRTGSGPGSYHNRDRDQDRGKIKHTKLAGFDFNVNGYRR